MRRTQIVSGAELLYADYGCTARRAMRQDRASHPAQTYHRDVVVHGNPWNPASRSEAWQAAEKGKNSNASPEEETVENFFVKPGDFSARSEFLTWETTTKFFWKGLVATAATR
jgi:hypothetical protein